MVDVLSPNMVVAAADDFNGLPIDAAMITNLESESS
jgi:hypothetical protein